MGYSEQINGFPQLSLSGIPSTKEQIWNGLTIGSPWQGVSLQQAEMEAAPRIMEAASQMPAVALEAVAQQPLPETFEEYMTNPERVAAAEKNTYNGPIFSTVGAFGHQTPEQMSIGHDAIYEYTPVGYVEQAISPSRWLYSGKTLFTDEPFQAPWNKDNPGLFTSISPEWGSLLDLGVDLSTVFIPYGIKGIRSLKGSPFGSKVRPVINTAKETATRSVPEASIESVIKPRVVVKDSPIIQIGNETGAMFDSNGRLVDVPALRLETQPLRIGTQPLSTESQVLSFNHYPQYIKRSGELGVAPSNLSQATAEFESLLDPTTHTIHTEQLLDKYPTFRDWFYGLTEADQKMVLRTPLTTPAYFADVIQDFMGTKLSLADKILIKTKLKPTSAFYNLDFIMAPLPDTPVKFGSKVLSGKGYTISKPGIITISPSQLVGTMPNADTPIDIGQMLVHEFSHAITLNNPMHQQFLKFTPEINAHLMGFNFDQFKNSQAVMDEVNWKAQLLLSQGKKVDYQALIEEEAAKLWDYMFKLGETEQLARLSQLKAFTKYESPYYLKSYTNWNNSKFKTVDDLKRAFQLYLAENFDNNMSTYYNMLELGGNRAWEQALHQINHWAPVIIPGIMGADAILSDSDGESSSDINDEL